MATAAARQKKRARRDIGIEIRLRAQLSGPLAIRAWPVVALRVSARELNDLPQVAVRIADVAGVDVPRPRVRGAVHPRGRHSTSARSRCPTARATPTRATTGCPSTRSRASSARQRPLRDLQAAAAVANAENPVVELVAKRRRGRLGRLQAKGKAAGQTAISDGAPGEIRTRAPASGGRCSIP
jgi:hypothetical protein